MLLKIFEYQTNNISNMLNIVEIELNNIGVGHDNFSRKTLLSNQQAMGHVCVCIYNTLLIEILVISNCLFPNI